MKVGDPVLFMPDCWVHGQGSESVQARTGAVRGKVVYILSLIHISSPRDTR